MEKVQRDALTSHIDDLGVQLRILRVLMPGARDNLNMARLSAFTQSVKRVCAISQELATAAGLNGHHEEEPV